MSGGHDVTPIIRSWLHEDAHEDAERVLSLVLDQLDTTPQRQPWWQVRRSAFMNNIAKLAIVAAAGAVVAVVAVNLLSTSGGVGGPSASAAPSSSAALGQSPSPTFGDVSPVSGDYPVGRYSRTVAGVPFTFAVPKPGWEPGPIRATPVSTRFEYGSLLISKSIAEPQAAEAVIFWTSFPEGTDADPCGNLLALANGGSAAELATALAAAAGTELLAQPSDATVGGLAAKHVVVKVREDLGCDPGYFYTWQDEQWGAFWPGTGVGDTIRVWIVDVAGKRLFIEAETSTSYSQLEAEIQQIVDSIRFE